MAFDSEELKRRREAREKKRQQLQAQQRKLRLKLILAAVVLIAVAVLIVVVSRGAAPGTLAQDQLDGQLSGTAVPATTQPTEAPETEPTVMPAQTVIHLAAAGDLNINDAVVDAGGVGRDYSRMLMDVMPLLTDADLTFLNFEGNAVGQPYGSENYSAPPELLHALVDAGVDMVQMANSRSISNGMIGLASTLQALENAGLDTVGAYPSVEEAKKAGGYTIQEVNGVKIAFVAFTKGMDSMALPEGSESCINLLYTDYATTYQDVDEDAINAVLKAARSEKPDIIIALLHWGSEYNDMLSYTQEYITDLMYEGGVSVIIGTHPHYVQSVEYDQDKNRLLCYSLGDFVSDTVRPGTEYSIVLDIEITKDNDTGETRVTDYSYTPIFTVSEGEGLKIVRLGQAIQTYEQNNIDAVSEDTYDTMIYDFTRVSERVASQMEEEE